MAVPTHNSRQSIERDPVNNATAEIEQGRQAFRFDTFGDEAFWGDTLKLHEAIEGAAHGGVGPGLTPRAALAAGLKVDIDALPGQVREQLDKGAINLDDPAVTLALLKLNAVVGVTGIFSSALTLQSIGIQCAFCHSTVDDSHPALCAGAVKPNPETGCIGHRLDAWANRDLNVGAIVALSPDLSAFASLLGADETTIRSVLRRWGPGKFDAGLILDGNTANRQQITGGIVTRMNVPGATLIPPAFGRGGVNLTHGVGRFFGPRLNKSKLSDLQFYQLSIASPQPPPGSVGRFPILDVVVTRPARGLKFQPDKSR